MDVEFETLKGKTIVEINGGQGAYELDIKTSDGKHYKMYHDQNCCEAVELAEVIGDLEDVINTPIVEAEVVSDSNGDPKPEGYANSWTWTFYKLRTIKGGVTFRWLGTSNGYYSERVDFREVIKDSWR